MLTIWLISVFSKLSPKFSKGRHKKDASDHSSEKERQAGKGDKENNNKKRRWRETILPKVAIDREQICPIDKSDLPEAILFKDYADVVIQDIKITTDNVKYRREVYYSPSVQVWMSGLSILNSTCEAVSRSW